MVKNCDDDLFIFEEDLKIILWDFVLRFNLVLNDMNDIFEVRVID